MPCLSYLMGGSNQAAVPAGCCSGIQSLYTAASTTPDRQGVCSCLKSGAASLGNNIDTNKAATLLSKCGVPFPYKISANIDCSKIQKIAMSYWKGMNGNWSFTVIRCNCGAPLEIKQLQFCLSP
ncbi:Non-specific lipid-transfer protein [Capsicum chinense]|nr:Non-specific lipid-transfer protein [Capsicum chinense]